MNNISNKRFNKKRKQKRQSRKNAKRRKGGKRKNKSFRRRKKEYNLRTRTLKNIMRILKNRKRKKTASMKGGMNRALGCPKGCTMRPCGPNCKAKVDSKQLRAAVKRIEKLKLLTARARLEDELRRGNAPFGNHPRPVSPAEFSAGGNNSLANINTPAIPQPGAVAGRGGVPAAPTPPPLPAPIAAIPQSGAIAGRGSVPAAVTPADPHQGQGQQQGQQPEDLAAQSAALMARSRALLEKDVSPLPLPAAPAAAPTAAVTPAAPAAGKYRSGKIILLLI